MTGSVGLAGSANIGDSCSMFEAIHGSAPRRAGQNLANPSGLFLGAIMMLIHIGQSEAAAMAHNAWLKTLEDGIHTYDIYKPNTSKQKAGTKEFADAVVKRIGEKPKTLKTVEYKPVSSMTFNYDFPNRPREEKKLAGVDVFIEWNDGTSNDFGEKMSKVPAGELKLMMISNRGLEVWPGGFPETFCVDHWRCRYEPEKEGADVSHEQIVSLLKKIHDAGFDFIKTENLYTFDGVKGYSTTQG
jgi:isocitrate dehydrogenase